MKRCLLVMTAAALAAIPAFANDPARPLQPMNAAAARLPNPADPAQAGAAIATVRPFACPRLATDGNKGAMNLGVVEQGRDGWFFRRGDDLSEEIGLPPFLLRDMARLSAVLKARGTTLVLAPTPTRGQMGETMLGPIDPDTVYDPALAYTADGAFRVAAGQAGLAILPVPARPADPAGFFKRDHHWTPLGAKAFASAVAARLVGIPALQDLPRQTYSTATGDTVPLESPMGRQLGTLCDEPLPAESVTLYRTEQKAQTADDLFGDGAAASPSAGADALFGGGDVPVIALAGTSFSAQEWLNFEGFLLEATGWSVANHSISGGGAYAPLLAYLSSPAWRDTPSPVLLWEFQRNGTTIKEASLALRQIIPAARGLCAAGAVAGTVKGAVSADGLAAVALKESAALSGAEDYAVIRLSDPSIRTLKARLTHADGQVEEVPLRRQERMPQLDTFFLEVSGDIEAPLTALSVTASAEKPFAAEVTLCRAAPSTP
jgi:alginate biosynthesis protein AlgX